MGEREAMNAATSAPKSRFIALAVLGALTAVVGLAPGAKAAFPGKPGKIAFTYGPAPATPSEEAEIATINPDGSGFTQLTNNNMDQHDSEAAYSADGKRILFGLFNSSAMDWQIVIMNSDGSGQDGLLNTLGPSTNPAFAPDGNSFAYVCDSPTDADICAWRTDGSGGLPPITDNALNEGDPAYARDGRLFLARSDGMDFEIFVRGTDGVEKQLTFNGVDDENPNPSPDGKLVAFTSGPVGGEIFVMDASDGSDQVNLTNSAASDSHPTFSPTGKQIAFQSEGDIAIMSATGGAATVVPNISGVTTSSPDWQPIPVNCGGKVATLVGTDDKDKLVGTSENDVIAGLGRKDKIRGKGGRDRICGGKGADKLNGGKGKKDKCIGGKGDDDAKACEREKGI